MRLERGTLHAEIVQTSHLCAEAEQCAVVAIDIPIGLSTRGDRTVDQVARRLLGAPRASSVFSAPPRDVLNATSYGDACERSFAASGKRVSKQLYGILPKIREVDHALRNLPRLISTFHEVHPEVSFHFMADGRSMSYSKRSRAGLRERLTLLEPYFGNAFDAIRAQFRVADAASNDIADAMAALWSAERIQNGTSVAVSGLVELDDEGLPIQMRA